MKIKSISITRKESGDIGWLETRLIPAGDSIPKHLQVAYGRCCFKSWHQNAPVFRVWPRDFSPDLRDHPHALNAYREECARHNISSPL